MYDTRTMRAEILESLARRRPAKTEAEQRLGKKRMQQARDIRSITRTEDKTNLREHIDAVRRARAMTDLQQSLEELKKGD